MFPARRLRAQNIDDDTERIRDGQAADLRLGWGIGDQDFNMGPTTGRLHSRDVSMHRLNTPKPGPHTRIQNQYPGAPVRLSLDGVLRRTRQFNDDPRELWMRSHPNLPDDDWGGWGTGS